MPKELRFPLYALADRMSAKYVFSEDTSERRLLLFSTAENASRYRSRKDDALSVVKLKVPNDLRTLIATQGAAPIFGLEIDPVVD